MKQSSRRYPAQLLKAAALVIAGTVLFAAGVDTLMAADLRAGHAKVDITDREAGPVNDPLYVKALVLDDGSTTAAIITVDAVALEEIGRIKNGYLEKVRSQLQKELNIKPENVLINASHCHGVVRTDVDQLTVQAVREASRNLVPVTVGAGTGHEDRIMENRRLKLKNGKDADVRHAYSLPPDEEVVQVGPVDPEIGVLRLDKLNGDTLAVVYNFACHPIQGVPNGGNTADFPGFASKVIEDNLGNGAMALFLQGAGGDINPVLYKDVSHPRDSRPFGTMLGLSTLQALRKIETRAAGPITILNEVIQLPRRTDYAARIAALEANQLKLLQSLRGTTLNLKTFLSLFVNHSLSPEFPSYYSHQYLHEKTLGRADWSRLDSENRNNVQAYLKNIYAMEQLTRNQVNLSLLKMHQSKYEAAGKDTIDAEVMGMRIGDFLLVSFPGELTVQNGLAIKQAAPHELTFVAGCTNGYLYYAPTPEQIESGEAQEDHDCLLAPEWYQIYQDKALEIVTRLARLD
jgi:hypothetical protein